MNLHKNARTTPHSRLLMVHRVLEKKQPAIKVAAAFGVSERTVRKWLARWRAGGAANAEVEAGRRLTLRCRAWRAGCTSAPVAR